jgi:predicted S18 family serine protease
MVPPVPIYLTTAIHKWPIIPELQENGLNPKLLKMIEALREEPHKSFKGKQKNAIEQVKEMDKNSQHLIMEIEAIKKIQTEAIMEIDSLRRRIGATSTSVTNKIQNMEERISGVKDTVKALIHWSKEMLSLKSL